MENLKQFEYVFHIALKDVKNTDTLESIIVRQHKGLSGNGVQPSEIKHLLERDANRKILLLLDGYDEYRRGNNAHIDKVITKDLYRNCSIVLASRETEQGSHSTWKTWKTWKNESTPGKPGNIMEF